VSVSVPSMNKPHRYVKANGNQRNGPQITEIDDDFISPTINNVVSRVVARPRTGQLRNFVG
jgi:hypothetical protein